MKGNVQVLAHPYWRNGMRARARERPMSRVVPLSLMPSTELVYCYCYSYSYSYSDSVVYTSSLCCCRRDSQLKLCLFASLSLSLRLMLLKRAFDVDDSQNHSYFASYLPLSLALASVISFSMLFDIFESHIHFGCFVFVLNSKPRLSRLWSVRCVPQSLSHRIFRQFIMNLTPKLS